LHAFFDIFRLQIRVVPLESLSLTTQLPADPVHLSHGYAFLVYKVCRRTALDEK